MFYTAVHSAGSCIFHGADYLTVTNIRRTIEGFRFSEDLNREHAMVIIGFGETWCPVRRQLYGFVVFVVKLT